MSEGKAAPSGVGDCSPGSREAEGEGGEGFISPEGAGAPISSYLLGGWEEREGCLL